MNDFNEDLKLSEDARLEPFWNEIYKKAFPNMTNHMIGKKDKCKSQEYGVDRIIYLENGKVITIDEKVRRKVWDDIALEYISNSTTQSPGWMEKDLSIDYLAYAFLPVKTVYLFDWRMLKRSWNYFKIEWKKKYPKIEAQNKNYITICVGVPIDVLMDICSRSTIIKLT
ncbi:MAG: hypothetical protein KKD44_28650 [Proteobacteria bacterium]|nr:hypothetical protein [Pseudomonadota bacterium]